MKIARIFSAKNLQVLFNHQQTTGLVLTAGSGLLFRTDQPDKIRTFDLMQR